MSSSFVDLKGLHGAYTRLSEKFKTYWTFHQFLQGIHKTFFGDAPGYKIDFQALYDQIKGVTGMMTQEPPAVVLDTINRLDLQLDAVYKALSEDDRKISPSHVRRFFEKVRTEDEKLLLSLLRFYFYERYISHDGLDKIDFLMTFVGARRSLDDGRYLPRFPVELQKLFGAFLSLIRRSEPDPAEVKSLVKALDVLRKDIEGCQRFEELTEKALLENVRTLKHRMGNAFYNVEVLSGILETNLAAKNKFQNLYEEEEHRILESSRQLLELERDLEHDPRLKGEAGPIQEELKKFREYKEEFERQNREKGVRHKEVTRLADSIERILTRFETATGKAASEATVPGAAAPAAGSGFELAEEPAEISADAELPADEPGARAGAGTSSPADASAGASEAQSDPLTAEAASKILFSVDMIDDGTGSGQAAYGKTLARLRLEPWEVRAARGIVRNDLPEDATLRATDLLFFDSAALRARIEEEAQRLKGQALGTGGEVVADHALATAAQCLVRAQELDRRFRQALEELAPTAPPEKLNELNRSRLRLVRAFSGLWLLHNSRTGM